MILINIIVNIKIRLFSCLYVMYCIVRLSKVSFAKVFFASLVLVCSGCPKHIDQTNVDNMLKNFAGGTIELGFPTFGYERYRTKMRAFYAAADWESLAKAVIEGDSHEDIDYYYLGRSAEGLGLYVAAKSYYDKAISTIFKCYKFHHGCDGFSFPQDITAQIESLRVQLEEKKNPSSDPGATQKESARETYNWTPTVDTLGDPNSRNINRDFQDCGQLAKRAADGAGEGQYRYWFVKCLRNRGHNVVQ